MRKIKQFFRNVYRVFIWIPVIWRDRWFDYSYLIHIIEFKLKNDSKYYEKNGCHLSHLKQAREMKIAAILCDRIYNNDYFCTKPELGKFNDDLISSYENYMVKQDIEYLCHILQKHLRNWWD